MYDKGDLLGLMQYGLWLTAVSTSERLRTRRCSVYEAGCLSSLDLELKAWRIPKELLVFSLR